MRYLILFFGSFLFFSCTTNQPDMNNKVEFDWQGHRGCRGILPENSIPGFLKALEYPIRTLELDIAVSKDKQIIVTHDPYFSHHICNKPDGSPVTEEEEKSILLYEMTYEEIKEYDCGSRGNKRFPEQQAMVVNKPSLKEVVEAVNTYCQHNKRDLPFYNIEIKSRPEWYDSIVPPPAKFVELLINSINELGIKEKTCIQSFDPEVMKEINRQAPKITNAFLVENLDGFDKNMAKLDFTPSIYSPFFGFITDSLVHQVHDRNMKLIPWTINEVKDMQLLIDLGVDGIITDYPNRIEMLESGEKKE